MAKIKVVVADDNRESRMRVISELRGDMYEVIADVSNGRECLEVLHKNYVDILLLDIVMPEMDGFDVLETLAKGSFDHKPHVFMVSNLVGDTFINRSIALGAEYYFVKPLNIDALKRRIADVTIPTVPRPINLEKEQQPMTKRYGSRSIDEKIANIFLSVGIPAHIKGYQFLRDAIKLVVSDPTYINSITKRLYPSIAVQFDTSSSKVERAIRHAIEVAWNRGKIENINKMFGFKVYGSNDKPTNGEFIALVADKLLLEGAGNQ